LSDAKPSTVSAVRDARIAARITAAWPLPGVRAGSALVRIGARLLAIQDDAFAAVWIDPLTRETEPLVLRGAGAALPKPLKPDFEAVVVAPDGAVFVLGSGSTARRRRIAHLTFGAAPAITLRDASPLYEALADVLGGAPNIEGAVLQGARLRLFHRGPGCGQGRSALLDVPAAALGGAAPRVLGRQDCDLGAIGGLALGFTDATALADGRVVYLAVAEDTPDGIADGPIAGAAVGVFDGQALRWTPLLEADGATSRRKVEGLALDAGAGAGWLLTDPDDPRLPAELCRLELNGLGAARD